VVVKGDPRGDISSPWMVARHAGSTKYRIVEDVATMAASWIQPGSTVMCLTAVSDGNRIKIRWVRTVCMNITGFEQSQLTTAQNLYNYLI